jgi:hypothetical protein
MAPLRSFAVLRRLRAHRTQRLLFFFFLLAVVPRSASAITRRDFPEGFVFGAGSSAFQVPPVYSGSSSSYVRWSRRDFARSNSWTMAMLFF